MLNVVVLNPGDELGFPRNPNMVYMVEPKNMGKFILDHPGAMTMILDAGVRVPHPYDPNATLSLDRAERLAQHGFMSLKRNRETLAAIERGRSVRESEAEYGARVKRDRSKKEAV